MKIEPVVLEKFAIYLVANLVIRSVVILLLKLTINNKKDMIAISFAVSIGPLTCDAIQINVLLFNVPLFIYLLKVY